MGMPVTQIFTVAGTGTPIYMDWTVVPFNAAFAVELKSGTASFGVQFTLDDPGAGNTTWFNDANVPLGSTTSTTGNYMFPIQAVRCIVSAMGGGTTSPPLQFVVLQGLPYPH